MNSRTCLCLRKRVPTVNNDVGTGHIAGCIRCTEDIRLFLLSAKASWNFFKRKTHALQLIALSHSICRNHAEPLFPPLLGVNIQNLGCDESGRDAIDAAKINPFHRQALGQLNNTSFGSIVLFVVSGYPSNK